MSSVLSRQLTGALAAMSGERRLYELTIADGPELLVEAVASDEQVLGIGLRGQPTAGPVAVVPWCRRRAPGLAIGIDLFPVVCVHGSRETAVQMRAKCGGIKPDLATSRPEAIPRRVVSSDRSARDSPIGRGCAST